MANDLSFAEQRARDHLILIRTALKELPDCCADFIRAIEPTTTALTRLAYVRDIRLFLKFLHLAITRSSNSPKRS